MPLNRDRNLVPGRGVAVAAVLAILLALSLMVAIGFAMLTTQQRSVGGYRGASRALYCAEAGLVAGRALALATTGQWGPMFLCNSGGACPAGYPLVGAAGADGSASYSVRLYDNTDELPPAVNNPLVDTDLTVVVVSTCTEAGLPPRTLREYVSIDPNKISDYRAQAGFGRARQGNQN